jgi:hypothetical protein
VGHSSIQACVCNATDLSVVRQINCLGKTPGAEKLDSWEAETSQTIMDQALGSLSHFKTRQLFTIY